MAHGTSGDHRPKQLWWGKPSPANRSGAGRTPGPRTFAEMADTSAVTASSRVRNVFPSSDPAQRFKAGGLIDDAGRIADAAALHALMVKLAECIDHASRTVPGDNPKLPSGYTYLLQFIAHDMSDSVSSLVMEDGAMRPGGLNMRQRPLMLETLYGGGPESHAHAFAVSEAVLVPNSDGLRTRLRVGQLRPPEPGSRTVYCPYRDLARAQVPEDDDVPDAFRRFYTEVHVADRRNDAHAFISQLTVLFQLLHNSIVRRLEELPDGPLPLQEAHRRYLCARTLVTLIYREILMTDVLPRILHPAVLQRYRNEHKPLLDDDPSVPVEFAHGAFRFAHAIVRDEYDVRGEGPKATFIGLTFNSASSPKVIKVPPTQIWFVDWARFFETAKTVGKPNLSKLIGPHYPSALRNGGLFPRKTDADMEGLANRDLLSACYGGLLSAPALSAKFQTIFGAQLVRSYDDWKAPLRAWLTAHWSVAPGAQPPAADVDRLVNDPPLPFFLMFEAEQACQGTTLGPIGSIIVAETIYGIITTSLTGFEDAGATLGARLEACAAAMFPDRAPAARSIAAELGGLTTMPAMLEHLAAIGELPPVP